VLRVVVIAAPVHSIDSMERISGPYKGYFIAAYSVPADAGFVGYAKVSLEEPQSVWSVPDVQKLTSVTGCRTELDAVSAAEQKARVAIANLSCGFDPVSAPAPLGK